MITVDKDNPYFLDMKDTIVTYIDRKPCLNKNEIKKQVKTKVIMNYDVKEVGSCYLNDNQDQKEGEFFEP
jgi:hypothetical protein